MEGKIDKNGNLFLRRGSMLKAVQCPYIDGRDYCGDWCGLFGEPVNGNQDGRTVLGLCRAVHIFTDFTDERGRENT